jgi:hypothetical protein
MKWFASVIVLTLSVGAWAQKKQYVGTYEAIRMAKGQPVDNNSLPPGQVAILELHAEGHWDMRDMLTGFDGTWHMSGSQLVLLTENGPTGKLKVKEKWILKPSPDRSRLVPLAPKILFGQIQFHFNPKIRAAIAKRLHQLK